MNRTSIPPIMIRNMMYENQNDVFIYPEITVIENVCARRTRPADRGCFNRIKSDPKDNEIDIIIASVIQRIV